MPELYIIDESWQEQSWFSTGGTRAKKYLAGPDGKFYYFKRSHYKKAASGEKDYKYEFWSEIIAYELGQLLGFNVLRYDIAIDNTVVGCISETMINSDKEELIEGVKYLQAFDNSFNPERNELRCKYTFELIDSAFDKYKLGKFKDQLLEMLVFDAIIGNGDRHQENWAVISEYTPLSFTVNEINNGFPLLRKHDNWLTRTLIKFFSELNKDKQFKKSIEDKLNIEKLQNISKRKFAPIYDSGSSLGRELSDERVKDLLIDNIKLDKYISKGLSEIHWIEKKLSHFDFLTKLISSSYHEVITNIIVRTIEKLNKDKLQKIILEIDDKLPNSYLSYKIPNDRKELIIRIILLRIEKLEQLIK